MYYIQGVSQLCELILCVSHTEYTKKRLDYFSRFVTGISYKPLICFISFSAIEAIQWLAPE
jgi:hypothetical protein